MVGSLLRTGEVNTQIIKARLATHTHTQQGSGRWLALTYPHTTQGLRSSEDQTDWVQLLDGGCWPIGWLRYPLIAWEFWAMQDLSPNCSLSLPSTVAVGSSLSLSVLFPGVSQS